MASRWGFSLAYQMRGGNKKKRDIKNVEVILLRELMDLAGWVYNAVLFNVDRYAHSENSLVL